jgi:pseudouridine-5'-phosphate glycosidase
MEDRCALRGVPATVAVLGGRIKVGLSAAGRAPAQA